MHDMLAAFHLARYLQKRYKEEEPARDAVSDDRFSVGLNLSRKLWEEVPSGCDSRR